MVEIVSPYFSNLGKRLVKSPKVYIVDSGITATLSELRSFEQMLSHSSLVLLGKRLFS
jgi:predicted AAA+ superfamily ATPase